MTSLTRQYNSTYPRHVELLAPARDASTAIAAINHGADAIYMGAVAHGARKQAANSIDDVERVVAYAHPFGVRVYVTVNTIVYENEIPQVESLIWELWRIGVDAIIVQDLGITQMNLPPIALHASTQCDIRTPAKARFFQDAGFSQIVLPRELTLDEIRLMRQATDVPLEAFVHGALCVSYSGDCQASLALTGRSANRGECAQICRYKFDLEDGGGKKIITGKHLLSLKDMNRLSQLEAMLDAGVSSFKIEGRLKDEGYVKNVVAAYSEALDTIVKASAGRYRRASRGHARPSFVPDVSRSFNRGFTSYFLAGPRPAPHSLASADTPKWIGEEVGRVQSQRTPRHLVATISTPLHNGDGLGYFGDDGLFCGFRLNRVEGNNLYTASDISVPRGAKLYRNADLEWNRTLEQSAGNRRIYVDMTIRAVGDILSLQIADEDGVEVSVTCGCQPQEARTPQEEARRRVLAKLGDTIFELRGMTDNLNGRFVPSSTLASLRREATDALMNTYLATASVDLRVRPVSDLKMPAPDQLSRHDNIANSLAKRFYCGDMPGNKTVPEAAEVDKHAFSTDRRVMQTRYCLRRELGACLKTEHAAKLPRALYLVSGNTRLELEFDCNKCRMNVMLPR